MVARILVQCETGGILINNNEERVNQTISSSEHGRRGVKSLLTERGLWPQQRLTRDQARKLLSSQPDFIKATRMAG